MGYDVDTPWRDLPKKDREWILFTEEQPAVPVYAGYTPAETRRALKRKEEPSYQGNFSSARRYVMSTFATTESASIKKRVARYMVSAECPLCHGKRLRRESLSVTFSGARHSRDLPHSAEAAARCSSGHTRTATPASSRRWRSSIPRRLSSHSGSRPTSSGGRWCCSIWDSATSHSNAALRRLSPGELQRLRLATQVRSNLFGVVYVLDEPSAGLHPADTQALLHALDRLKASGNSLFVVEHELDVIDHADWIVDVGPAAGENGGRVLYSGPPAGLRDIAESRTRQHLFGEVPLPQRSLRRPTGTLTLEGVTRNNLRVAGRRDSRSASSRPSLACPVRASRASSARCWWNSLPWRSGTTSPGMPRRVRNWSGRPP